MTFLKKRRVQALGAWALCLTQVFWVAGCRQQTGGGSGSSGRVAAGASAGVNMGQILYEVLHQTYVTKGETAQAQALAARQSDFVSAVNRIIPNDVGSNLFSTLGAFLPIVDDGTVERAAADVDAIIVDLLGDPTTLDALVKLLDATSGGGAAGTGDRSRNQLISRLLAYPELETLARSIFELVRDNDGVDERGQPNGERNLLRELQGLLSRQLLGFQPAPGTGNGLAQTIEKLSEALLSDQPLAAFPDLGAPAWAVRLDVHGNPKVLADPATGRLPAPFVDQDGDGAADVDAQGRPVDAQGGVISLPAFGNAGTRDADGRALAPGGALYYVYFDAKRTLVSELLLLTGEMLGKDLAADVVAVLDGCADRVQHDNGTADPSDDYETLSPDTPLLDLTHAQFELIKRTSMCDLLRGLGAVVKQDRARFSDMVDNLVVAVKKASAAAAGVQAQPGAGQALLDDLLPLVEDALRPRGRSISAVRALLQAFNTEQRRLQNLPASFARMMKYHDYRSRTLADANRKSIMQRVVEMMERANTCNVLAGSPSNMADFYLAAMAGNARVLGINISIGTINNLVDISIIRNILCSSIREDDVRALKDFNDTGALDAMKPICKVFDDRGEITLLKNIMLGLGRHYERAMRPTEKTAVAILESGAVEKLFLCIDSMTQVRVPGSNEVVADVLADTLAQVVDSSQPIYDRRNRPHRTLVHLLSKPMDDLKARCQARGIGPRLDNLMAAAEDVLLQTYVDARGVERWKWGALNRSLGQLVETLGDMIPQAAGPRGTWAYDQQRSVEQMLASRDAATLLEIAKTVGASPQKSAINRAIANLFTPAPSAAQDAFGGVVALLGDVLQERKGHAAQVDRQALATVLHFFGRQLDPAVNRANGIVELIRKLLTADDGMLVLRLARNAFDMGPNGTDESAVAVLQSVFDDIGAAASGSSGPMTVADLRTLLEQVHDFLNDAQEGLPRFVARIKAR
ncbi:MAG: hypothetical protein KIT58_08250 [Planctomycetota bacterium]|nr:hypothetical protein [Planctomycetota bacterium]